MIDPFWLKQHGDYIAAPKCHVIPIYPIHIYVFLGLSRVRSFDSLTIVAPNQNIENCVYSEIFDEV